MKLICSSDSIANPVSGVNKYFYSSGYYHTDGLILNAALPNVIIHVKNKRKRFLAYQK